MDIEKAIQSLIEIDIRAQKRADRADERMDKLDKQLRVTANLVRGGIKLVKEEWKKQKEENKELNFKINALIDSQDRADERMRKSEDKFNRWLDEMRKETHQRPQLTSLHGSPVGGCTMSAFFTWENFRWLHELFTGCTGLL